MRISRAPAHFVVCETALDYCSALHPTCKNSNSAVVRSDQAKGRQSMAPRTGMHQPARRLCVRWFRPVQGCPQLIEGRELGILVKFGQKFIQKASIQIPGHPNSSPLHVKFRKHAMATRLALCIRRQNRNAPKGRKVDFRIF
jgi:hypothetical protein